MQAATFCVLAASKSGVNFASFEKDAEWLAESDGSGFRHRSAPVSVTFPKDSDGVARVCEARATLASQDDQSQMVKAFEILLKKKPVVQSDSVIWLLNTKTGPRGLQIFSDKKSPQPQVRLVGAAF